MTLQPGTLIENFEIISPVGQGAFGTVYKARDTRIKRLVAIKELRAGPSGLGTSEFSRQKRRFEHEVETLGRFTHSNVVAAYQIIGDAQAEYLVMEYVDGGTLKHRLAGGRPLTIAEAVSITLDICQAIEEMAKYDIVHRDIKPANILLASSGRAKLTDFGIAQVGAEKHISSSGKSKPHPGSASYKSPEQEHSTEPLDQRSDLYALGLVLHEMLAGKSYRKDPRPVRQVNAAVPRAVAHVLNKTLQADPAKRYQTAGELAQALQQARSSSESGLTKFVLPPQRTAHHWLWLVPISLMLLVLAGWAIASANSAPLPQPVAVTLVFHATASVRPTPASTVTIPSPTATPLPPTSLWPYGSLAVQTSNEERYRQTDQVVLVWEPPTNLVSLADQQAYGVIITYVDQSGQPQVKQLTTQVPLIELIAAEFFTQNKPLGKDGRYAWQVVVVETQVNGEWAELSPRTPPFVFYWTAVPPTAAALPQSKPVVTATPNSQPNCPSGQFYDPYLNRCKSISPNDAAPPIPPMPIYSDPTSAPRTPEPPTLLPRLVTQASTLQVIPTKRYPRVTASATSVPANSNRPLDFSFYASASCYGATQQQVTLMITAQGGRPPYSYYNDSIVILKNTPGSATYQLIAAAGNPVPFKLVVVDSAGQRYVQDFFYKSGLSCYPR